MQIGKTNLLPIRNTKPPIHSRRLGSCSESRLGCPARACPERAERVEGPKAGGPERRARPALPRIHRLIIPVIRRPSRLRHILPRTFTRINKSQLAQPPPRLQVMPPPLTLHIRPKRPAAIRPLTPRNPQPPQILDHRVNEFRATSLRIQIFITQNQLPTILSRASRRNPKRPRMPQMQQPSRRRRQPPTIGRKD
jgi:hypothetical protein